MDNHEKERLLIELFRQLSPLNQSLVVDSTRELLNDQYQDQIALLVEDEVVTAQGAEMLRQTFIERNVQCQK